MKSLAVSIILYLCCQFINAQDDTKLHLVAKVGLGVLTTVYESKPLFGSGLPEERESIISTPRPTYALGVSVERKISERFQISLTPSLYQNGYTYKIHDFLEKEFVRLKYKRLELDISIGAKVSLFAENIVTSSYGKERRKKRSAPYVFMGYNVGIALYESYNYASLDGIEDLAATRRSILHGYIVGLGVQKNIMDFRISFHSDINSLVVNNTKNRFFLRDLSIGLGYLISGK